MAGLKWSCMSQVHSLCEGLPIIFTYNSAYFCMFFLILSSRLQVGLKCCQNVSIFWKCASAYFMTASNAISCPLSLKYICCYEESLKRLVLGCGCHFFNAWNAAAVIQSLSVCQGRQHHHKGLVDRWHQEGFGDSLVHSKIKIAYLTLNHPAPPLFPPHLSTYPTPPPEVFNCSK